MRSRYSCVAGHASPLGDPGRDLTAYQYGRTIYVIRAGGGASRGYHFASDLQTWTLVAGKPGIKAVTQTDNMTLLSTSANDHGYEHVLVEQVRTLLSCGDVLIALSSSGTSSCIMRAVEGATELGAMTVALRGYVGDDLMALTDHSLVVPADRIDQIKTLHVVLSHAITDGVRRASLEAEGGYDHPNAQDEAVQNDH